tara:strand:+ start:817 stop:2955 length:2139 start_codon:yes stop_codon:yes gene_type:complete
MAQENYKTFDFAPYESNFATGRREELADRTKQEFDTNKAEYDILQRTIGSLETTDFNKKYVNQMNKDIEKKMEGVLQTGRYDLAGFGVADSLTRYMTDTTVKNAVESFQMIKKEDQVNAANPNKVHRYYEVPVMLDENLKEWTAADYKVPNKKGVAQLDANDNPIMKDLRQEHDAATGAYAGNSEEALDHVKRAATMMQSIADDTNFIEKMIHSYKREGITIDADTAKKFILNGRAITDEKVAGLADELIDEYASTPEGLQRIQALSLKLSSNVEYYGKDPLMQLNSDEEIREILLNDLRGAGQTQIGQTMTTTGITQDRVGPTPPAPQADPLKYVTYNPGVSLDKYNTAHTKIKTQLAAGKKSRYYSADGSIKADTDIPDPDNIPTANTNAGKTIKLSLDQASIRGSETLAQIQVLDPATGQPTTSTNPLDIEDEYQRAAYILKGDYGNIRPANVSDAAHVMAVEKMLAEGTHITRQITGIPTEHRPAIAKLLAGDITAKDARIYDPEVQGGAPVNADQWSTELDPSYVIKEPQALRNALIDAFERSANNTSSSDTDLIKKIQVRGITYDPKHPGAYEVIITPQKGESKTIFVEGAKNNREFFTPAARLVAVMQGNYRDVEVPVPTTLASGETLYIKQTVVGTKDSSGNLKYESVINLITKDPAGNVVAKDEVDPRFIDAVTTEAFKTYVSSPTPGSTDFSSRIDPKDAYQ